VKPSSPPTGLPSLLSPRRTTLMPPLAVFHSDLSKSCSAEALRSAEHLQPRLAFSAGHPQLPQPHHRLRSDLPHPVHLAVDHQDHWSAVTIPSRAATGEINLLR
jgi:hypothetical protein